MQHRKTRPMQHRRTHPMQHRKTHPMQHRVLPPVTFRVLEMCVLDGDLIAEWVSPQWSLRNSKINQPVQMIDFCPSHPSFSYY